MNDKRTYKDQHPDTREYVQKLRLIDDVFMTVCFDNYILRSREIIPMR
ncbi:hypothetical protein SAMN02910456_02155 [Ruminococcaceae bacterium YRB3002]|nr:hypothetical protein SAMN02910456_02155 [Ruminococcaceae bacterium YRB3002]